MLSNSELQQRYRFGPIYQIEFLSELPCKIDNHVHPYPAPDGRRTLLGRDGDRHRAWAWYETSPLALFGPQITFRAQPHGTFKLLFNGIVQSTVQAAP